MQPSSATAKIGALVAYGVAIIVLIHPGWKQPTWIGLLIPILGLLFAGGVQLYDLITHHLVKFAVAANLVGSAPAWLTATWLTQTLKIVITAVVGIVALTHPGFTEPASIEAAIPTISALLILLVPFLDRVFNSRLVAFTKH